MSSLADYLAWAHWLDDHAECLDGDGLQLTAGAMRGIADRIRTLTADNERLRADLKLADQSAVFQAGAQLLEKNKPCECGMPSDPMGSFCSWCGHRLNITKAEVRALSAPGVRDE